MPPEMEGELEEVVRILAQNRWPWRLHATYDETISRALDVFEKVNQDIPLDGLHWFFDHAETISDKSIDRIAALGGGIAVQHRMAYQGEYFVERYGHGAAEATPPVAKHAGAGREDLGRHRRHPRRLLQSLGLARLAGHRQDGRRACASTRNATASTARRRCGCGPRTSRGSPTRKARRVRIEVGQFADLVVPDRDYFACAEDEIADIAIRSDDRRRQGRLRCRRFRQLR